MPRFLYSIIGAVALLAVIFAAISIFNPESHAGDNIQATYADNGDPVDDSAKVTGAPKIFFPETTHNFGTVAQGEKVTHEFVVKNNGDAPLKLIKAKGS